jgi:glycosyltransferase A (GT-A) superfamily protein (DUF2064 family)
MNDPGILVMAKAPVPGRVKTRLCPPCTPLEAADIARAALCDTLGAAVAGGRSVGRSVVLALAGEPGPWVPPEIHVVAQIDGTFNERLRAAWTHLPNGGIQIGMDTPQVTAELLEVALQATAASGAALGPADDGGWWILGLRRPDERVFDDVAMSTATTGRQQLDRLRALGYSPALLPVLTDIDSWADACQVASSLPGSRTAAAVSRVTAASPTIASTQ